MNYLTNVGNQDGYGRLQLQPSNKNGILVTHFQFELRKISNVTYFCQSANLPGISIRSIEQITAFNPIKRPGGEVAQEDFTINFMVDEELKNWFEIRNWIDECSTRRDSLKYKGPEKHLSSEGVLFILESNNQPRFKVSFEGMFPVSLGGLSFQTGADSGFQYSSATFSYTTFEVTKI